MGNWKKVRFNDLPASLRRANKFYDQFNENFIYKIVEKKKTYWVPLSEVARMLFFHSSEVVRAAVYHGNTWQLGKAWSNDWRGEVELSSNIPVRYINSLQYRKFFAWLLFDHVVEDSFGSIHQAINKESKIINDAERWTFNFNPPDLSHCEVSIAGFTGAGEEFNQVFVREIRSVAGLKSPDLDVVYFSHPDDDTILKNYPENSENKNKIVNINLLESENKPKASKKRYLVRMKRSGLNFDVEPDTRRISREIKVIPAKNDLLINDSSQIDSVTTASVQQGSNGGSGLRADVDQLEEPELVDAPEKLFSFNACFPCWSKNTIGKLKVR